MAHTSDLIIFDDGAALNLRHLVHCEWFTPAAAEGEPALERSLVIVTDMMTTTDDGTREPYTIFLGGEQADRAWALIQTHALPAPELPVTFDGCDSFRCTVEGILVEVVSADGAEVIVNWPALLAPAQAVAVGRAVEAITSDPRFLAAAHQRPIYTSAAD